MPRQEAAKAKFQDRLDELKTLRDNIRVDLQLASMELRDEWKNLERKLIDPATAAEQLRDVTAEMIERLAAELRGFRERLRTGADSSVQAIMTKDVATCAPQDTLAQALTAMWNRDVGWLPVLDADTHVIGVVTDRDAAIAACTRGKCMDEIQVETVMGKDVVTCPPETSPEEALALMRSRRVRRLPVVTKDGNLVGVVTLTDLTRSVVATTADGGRASMLTEVVAAWTTITEPRSSEARSTAN